MSFPWINQADREPPELEIDAAPESGVHAESTASPSSAELHARRATLRQTIAAAETALDVAKQEDAAALEAWSEHETQEREAASLRATQVVRLRQRQLAQRREELEQLDVAIKLTERAELERRRDELIAANADRSRQHELDAETLRCALTLVDAMLARAQHDRAREVVCAELDAIMRQLDPTIPLKGVQSYQQDTSWMDVRERLQELAREAGDADRGRRRAYLNALANINVNG